eukprot:GHVT01020514.1.p1 GENE.GHVT01020514.1~~GHVT01020514.1.p1  ORF type:complete len:428 (+),score=72.32 GHVT01020514.1:186-1469(+)
MALVVERQELGMAQLQEQAEVCLHASVGAVTERKTRHMNALTAAHTEAEGKLRQFYTTLLQDAVQTIETLKAETAELNAKSERHKQELEKAVEENNILKAPLEEKEAERRLLEENLRSSRNSSSSMALLQSRFRRLSGLMTSLSEENNSLAASERRLLREVSEYPQRVSMGLAEIQRKSGGRLQLLDRKRAQLEVRYQQVSEKLQSALAANGEADRRHGHVEELQQLQTLIKQKNELIVKMKEQLLVAQISHDKLISNCKETTERLFTASSATRKTLNDANGTLAKSTDDNETTTNTTTAYPWQTQLSLSKATTAAAPLDGSVDSEAFTRAAAGGKPPEGETGGKGNVQTGKAADGAKGKQTNRTTIRFTEARHAIAPGKHNSSDSKTTVDKKQQAVQPIRNRTGSRLNPIQGTNRICQPPMHPSSS